LPKCGRSRPLRRRAPACAALLRCGVALSCAAGLGAPAAAEDERFVVGDFAKTTTEALPASWQPVVYPRIPAHTRYAIVSDPDAGRVVEARADASASALARKVDVDARRWPVLEWRWKVGRLVDKSDPARKEGDDYPARIYVSFAYDPARVSLLERAWYFAARLFYGEYPPQSGINYIWARDTRVGAVVTNAYTSRVRMIVVESGPERLGVWRAYSRDVVDDYRRAFGDEPPRISGIAIMTDTDDTRESTVAWYGDIALRHR
jgi:hypothetical protein